MANFYTNPYYPYMQGYSSNTPAYTSASPLQPTNNGVIWIQGGENGAKAFPVAPGANALLMDSEDTKFYIKSVDKSGVPLPLRSFEYKEITAAPENKPEPSVEYATKKDLEDLKAEILSVNKSEKVENNE